jgi:DNA-binding NarL/FixJ family response regulator
VHDDGIAHQLRLSEADVRTHHHVYAKLGIDSRPALVRYAQDNALV